MLSSPCNSEKSASPEDSASRVPPAEATEKHTYGQILKSSALIGGSSVLNIALGIVRTKAMALLLGPTGFGLFGLYGSIANLVQSVAGMGISSSGVRQIAVAVGSGDTERIGQTTTVLRRTSIFLGMLGTAFLVLFSRQVSTLTFGGYQQTAAVCLLSVAVFFQLVSWGQSALIQGMRRISDLAKIQLLGGLFGTLASILLVYLLRDRGVVPSLVSVSLMYLVVSWWYSRQVHIQPCPMTGSQVRQEAAALLKLGFAFMAANFMATGIAYAVRLFVLRRSGLEAAGIYQSAWTLGGLYVGFILQAMGADFYPRLTANADDNAVCNRLVNEQVRVSLLLATPGVIATLVVAPVVIALFYSVKFGAAVGVLRWMCLGSTLQVVTWPLAYIIIAKGRQGIYFTTELTFTLASLGLSYACVRYWGVNGAGIAFFASAIVFGLVNYPVAHRLSGYRWSTSNKQTGLFSLALIAVVFCGVYALPMVWAVCLGTVAAIVSVGYSLRVLSTLVSWEHLPVPLRRLLIVIHPMLFRSTNGDERGEVPR